MEYNYKKYTHRHKSLKSASNYLSRFYDNLALDYDGDSVYDSTIQNLRNIKELCDKISERIDNIISSNSKELNEVKYTYLSLMNTVGNFNYLNYQAVINASKQIDSLVNHTIIEQPFTYGVAEELPHLILKSVFLCSIQSNDYEYTNYVRSTDIHSIDISSVVNKVDLGHTALYALVLYNMLWDYRLKPMGKYHTKYYLSADSMCDFVRSIGVADTVIDYYKENGITLVERVGIK